MKASFNSRTWHFWISALLAVPILIVSVTAIFIAHDKSLGLKDIPVAAGWLPGYAGERGGHETELRAVLVAADGSTWLGAKGGLVHTRDDRATLVAAFAGEEVRSLTESPAGILVGTKKGVWLGRGDDWQQVLHGEAWHIAGAPDGTVRAVLKDRGLLASGDGGRRWQAAQALTALQALPQAPAEALTLGKLVMDLHTGKALFGKQAMWLWIDAIGLVMAFLSTTGIYLWWRGLRRKSQLPAQS